MEDMERTKDPLEELYDLDGLYMCPKGSDSKRLGPLVGYAGRYDGDKQYVGDLYANFAMAEQHPDVYHRWAARMTSKLTGVNVCLGMPMGGILFAEALAYEHGCRVAFAEKKITALATDTSREKSELVLGRHTINPGDRVAIVEDVVNNFSTTEQAINLLRKHGANPMSVVCILNRSDRKHYDGSESLLVKSLVFRPFPQYRQDDPTVADDVAIGNVVWKPKALWEHLKTVMRERE